jgi:hypothetical protein
MSAPAAAAADVPAAAGGAGPPGESAFSAIRLDLLGSNEDLEPLGAHLFPPESCWTQRQKDVVAVVGVCDDPLPAAHAQRTRDAVLTPIDALLSDEAQWVRSSEYEESLRRRIRASPEIKDWTTPISVVVTAWQWKGQQEIAIVHTLVGSHQEQLFLGHGREYLYQAIYGDHPYCISNDLSAISARGLSAGKNGTLVESVKHAAERCTPKELFQAAERLFTTWCQDGQPIRGEDDE